MDKPPVIATPRAPQRNRTAWLLNAVAPGAGQLMLGQIALGIILLLTFLIDFAAMLVLFVVDFKRYMDLVLNGNILADNKLEQISGAYHVGWLLALLAIGIIIYAISFVALARSEMTPKPMLA